MGGDSRRGPPAHSSRAVRRTRARTAPDYYGVGRHRGRAALPLTLADYMPTLCVRVLCAERRRSPCARVGGAARAARRRSERPRRLRWPRSTRPSSAAGRRVHAAPVLRRVGARASAVGQLAGGRRASPAGRARRAARRWRERHDARGAAAARAVASAVGEARRAGLRCRPGGTCMCMYVARLQSKRSRTCGMLTRSWNPKCPSRTHARCLPLLPPAFAKKAASLKRVSLPDLLQYACPTEGHGQSAGCPSGMPGICGYCCLQC